MQRFIGIALGATLLVGSFCRAADKEYVLPAANGLATDQVARVLAVSGPKNVASRFVGLFDEKRREIRVRKFPVVPVTGNVLTLTPGNYAFTLSCAQPVGEPKYLGLSMTVAAGRTYSVWCEPIPWSIPVVRFKEE